MTRHLLISCIGILAALAGHAVTVTVPATAVVSDTQILLGAVAKIDGTQEEQQKFAAMVLGSAPPVGQSRDLSPGMIRMRFRQYYVNPDTVDLVCPEKVQVTRLATALAGDALTAAAEAWLKVDLHPGKGEELQLTPLRVPADLQLPDGEITWQCSAAGGSQPGLRNVQVVVLAAGQPVWRGIVSFKVQFLVEVLVAKASLARGKVLTADLVSVERRDIAGERGVPLRDAAALVGSRTKTAISAGEMLTTDGVEPQPLVKKNEAVRVRFAAGALMVTLVAVACEDGADGQTIRVRNPQTHLEFTVRVLPNGETEAIL